MSPLIIILIRIFCICVFLILLFYVSVWVFLGKYELLKIIYSFILIILFFKLFDYIKDEIPKNIKDKLFPLVGFDIRYSLMTFFLLLPIIIKAPYLRHHLNQFTFRKKSKQFIIANSNTYEQILEFVEEMSEKKIGALLTLEKYNSLEQFAKKSILIDGFVSKELLMNIFIPNTPLHDGAVIIRGNKILSAGAYFMLSEKHNFKHKTGSRHRAALGISEITDSMTIIISEETGNVSIALEGILLKIKDINQIREYLTTFAL